jgi:hypothetical protein
MAVDEAQTLETSGGKAVSREVGDHDAPVVAYDDIGNLALSRDEKADLPVYFTGQFRQLPGQLVGNDVLRRHTSPVKLPDPSLLIRSQTGQIAVYLFDGFSSLLVSILTTL